jgi:hypothetical protein
LTDPDAWKKNIADIVGQKNQLKVDAALREQARQDHVTLEQQTARAILQDQPQEGFQEFAAYLQSQGDTAEVRYGWEDAKDPWIAVAVSDKAGLIIDVRLEARIGSRETTWFWVYEHGGNRRKSLARAIPSSDAAPSKQYVLETLVQHYHQASENRR